MFFVEAAVQPPASAEASASVQGFASVPAASLVSISYFILIRTSCVPFLYHFVYTNWCDAQEDNQCLGEEAVEEEEDNDKDYVQDNDEEDEEEEEVVAAVQSPASAKAASSVQPASCVLAAGSVQAASGHVVQNHNQQRDILGSNFIGRTSFLAIHYDPPLGPFSESFFRCTFCCTRIHLY